jgi:hypothetical protein
MTSQRFYYGNGEGIAKNPYFGEAKFTALLIQDQEDWYGGYCIVKKRV